MEPARAASVWDTALASTWEQAPVWVLRDVPPSNLLVAGGAPHAVIDFGCAAVGDPACDIVVNGVVSTDSESGTYSIFEGYDAANPLQIDLENIDLENIDLDNVTQDGNHGSEGPTKGESPAQYVEAGT